MIRGLGLKKTKSFGSLAMQSMQCQFVPFDEASGPSAKDILVVDCTAPTRESPTLTHHKKNNNPINVPPHDTSTGITLNAIRAGSKIIYMSKITTNHFDVDSFLSVWCILNRELAAQFDPVLRNMSRIGDFREALMTPELINEHHQPGEPAVNIKDVFTALKLVCWLNTEERSIFSAPYVAKDSRAKFDFFLPIFADILQNPEAFFSSWQEEYRQVVTGFDCIRPEDVESLGSIGLSIVRAEDPLHYYSLFSHSIGSDYVLSIYDGNRFELEAKYTQFVDFHSRPVFPRLDFGPLASTLNLMETNLPQGSQWVSPRFTDTGPLLRLEDGSALSKAKRYGHPCERPFVASSLSPDLIRAVVISYLDYGLKSAGPLGRPKKGGFTWDELHTINNSLQWRPWIQHTLESHNSKELEGKMPSISPKKPTRDAVHLIAPPGSRSPQTSEASRLLTNEDIAAIASQLPGHFAVSPWHLAYCTHRDGYSLSTLYRKCAASRSKEHIYCSILVIQDSGGGRFGCVAFAPWAVHPHQFYGTGETSVFQLSPRKLMWKWNEESIDHRTDFFQYSSHDAIGVGGAGHFAIWVDNDLLDGTSNACETFHSPCLASQGDFKVDKLEVWHCA